MNIEFYERYKDRDTEELFKIIYESENYQPDLIVVIKRIISQRALNQELKEYIDLRSKKEWNFIKEQSSYLKELNYLKENGFSRTISPEMTSVLENKLVEKEIRFVNEQKIEGTYIGPLHAAYFHFYNEDLDKVDDVFVELGWAEKAELSKISIFSYKNFLIGIIGILMIILYAQKCTY
jgi:hypothetical protein